MLAGGMFVLAALLLMFYNSFADSNAGAASEEVLSLLDMENVTADEDNIADYLVNPQMALPKKTVDGNKYVGVISIPALDISLPVMSEWSSENSKIAPCVYDGTPYLDNMIIAGHNYKTHFGPISNLQPGDRIEFKDIDGNVFRYDVMYIETIDGKAIQDMNSGEWDLTLFTCTYSGTSRITVRCKNAE